MEDVNHFAARLAPEDQAEMFAAFGLDPEEGLRKCHSMSTESVVLVQDDGTIVSWWGAIEVKDAQSANVWLLCGPEVKDNPIAWSRLVRQVLSSLSTKYGVLFLYADERNFDHVRWIERIGFKRLTTVQGYGYEGRTFLEYAGVF